jgi:hypothetical protein
LAEHWNGTTWGIQPTPTPSGAQFSFLNAVSCTSVSACTTVGGYGNTSGEVRFFPLAERWDGTKWHIQPTPSPPIPSFAFHLTGLNAVACTSASACTAVGGSMSSLSTPVTLAERWNGTTWAIQATPNRAGAAASGLFSVACPSPGSCMAVGGTSSPNDLGGFLAERWNGTHWSILPTPPAGQPGGLFGVACVTSASCQAVGTATNRSGVSVTLAERWTGTHWSIEPTPNLPGARHSQLAGISCSSAHACTAVGGDNTTGSPSRPGAPLAERWNGTKWSIQPTPNPAGGGSFGGVSCPTSSLCFAAGASNSGAALIEQWNGTSWRIVPAPNPPGGGVNLGPVSCTSAVFCMTTGNSNSRTLAERWNGTRWSIVPTPTPAGGGGLGSVSCTSPSACTAVGGSNSGALAERWNGTRWSVQPTPSPAMSFQITLDSVACPAPGSCTAVGDYGLNATGAERVTLGLQWRGTMQGLQGSSARSRLGFKCAGFPAARRSLAGCGCAWPLRPTSARWLNPAQPWHWSPARLLPGLISPAWPSPLRGCPPL